MSNVKAQISNKVQMPKYQKNKSVCMVYLDFAFDLTFGFGIWDLFYCLPLKLILLQ